MLEARFVLNIFTFCPDFSVMQENEKIRKLKLNSKFMMSQTG